MLKKLSFLLIQISLFCFIILSTGCTEEESINTPLVLDLKKTGNIQFLLNKSTATQEVDTVTALLTRSGYFSIRKDINIINGSATGTINDVASGLWQLLVEAKDSSGTVLYRGKTDADIKGNEITYVSINLAAVSATGDLAINVTWHQEEGVNWTKHTAPILNLGTAGSWDDAQVIKPSVIYDGKIYKMWYNGHDGTNWRIGYATSSDGINWTKYTNNPVLDLGGTGSWDEVHVYNQSVIFDGLEYKMWYSGSNGTNRYIGYATSPDGINWTKYAGNPVVNLGTPGSWDDTYVYAPNVIFDGSEYKMWYGGYDGTNWRIGYAISSDGINWTKHAGNPVVDLGGLGSWDVESAYKPTVVFTGSLYKMWYSGYDGTNWRIGYATSPDGTSWTKYANNPVLNIGGIGSWDENYVYAPNILFDGINYKMWYSGYDGTNWRIGYATAP